MSGPGVELTKEYLDNLFRPFEEEAERKRMRKAIREAMPKAMARAMPKAMEIAMPKAMEIAMPKAMEKAMEEAMPKAMEEAMPKAMEKARELVAAESGAKYHDMLLGAAQRAWRRRFDTDLPAKHRAAVSALSPDRLIALLDAIPDFPAPAALAKWLR